MADSKWSGHPAAPRHAWIAVGLLWVAFLINYVDRQVVFGIFPALQQDLGFTSAQLGLVGSIFIWVYSLVNPVVGRVADIIRRDRLIVASLVSWSLATLGTGLSRSVNALLMWRALLGVTQALYYPAALAFLGTLHSTSTRSRALALHGTAQLAGIVIGTTYGGWMADHFGWRLGMFALTALGLAYAPLLWLCLRRLPRSEAPAQAMQASPADLFRSYCYWALAITFFCFCLMLWMIYGWLPTFIYEKYGLSMTESGFTATIYLQVTTAVGVLTGGVVADRLVVRVKAARFHLVAAGIVVSSPFAYLTLAVDSLTLLKAASGMFGLLSGMYMANVFAACYDVISERNYGLGTGLLNMIGGLAGGMGIFMAGHWKEAVGIATLMGWGAVAACVAGLLLAAVVNLTFADDRQRAGIEPAVRSA